VTRVLLPRADGTVGTRVLNGPRAWQRPDGPSRSRVAFAAAHVVPRIGAENVPGAPADLDWDATLAFRERLWGWGLGVAEAMDTAQRGMGLDWAATHELITRSAARAREVGGRIAAGAGTDHLAPGASVEQVLTGYLEQVEVVEQAGAQVIVMASRHLAAAARGSQDYLRVYSHVLERTAEPVILHWLGEAFDPALAGYWGSGDLDVATETVLELVHAHASAVDGIKVSLLDAERERTIRAALPAGVRLYTGDDFHYPELIAGDHGAHSDALLGVFAAIAPAASAGLQALDAGDTEAFHEVLDPTLPLARHLFAAPTYYYKTGIAFLAWLDGAQPGFAMVGGLHSARSAVHLARCLELADDAGLLADPELAARRWSALAASYGVEA